MTRSLQVLGVTCITAAAMLAASPVASVTSAQSFMLRGHEVPVLGIPNWSMMAGDDIATRTAPAELRFQDGSRIILDGNSRGKIEQANDKTVFRLQSGSAVIKNNRGSQVVYMVGNSPVSAREGVETFVSSNLSHAPASTITNRRAPSTGQVKPEPLFRTSGR